MAGVLNVMGQIYGSSFDSLMAAKQADQRMSESNFDRLLNVLQQKQVNKQRQQEFAARQAETQAKMQMRMAAMADARDEKAKWWEFREREAAKDAAYRSNMQGLAELKLAEPSAAEIRAQQDAEERIAYEAALRQGAERIGGLNKRQLDIEGEYSSLPTKTEIEKAQSRADPWFGRNTEEPINELRRRYASVLPWDQPFDIGAMSIPDLQQAALNKKNAELAIIQQSLKGIQETTPEAFSYVAPADGAAVAAGLGNTVYGPPLPPPVVVQPALPVTQPPVVVAPAPPITGPTIDPWAMFRPVMNPVSSAGRSAAALTGQAVTGMQNALGGNAYQQQAAKIANEMVFESEAVARARGFKAGDVIRLMINGRPTRVQLR